MTSVVEAAKIIGDIIAAINIAESFIHGFSEKAAVTIEPTAKTMLMLYIIIWGWAMARGMVQEPVVDAAMRFVKLVAIYVFATNWGIFSLYITNFVTQTPDAISLAITGADSNSTAAITEVFSFALKVGSEFVIDAEEYSGGGAGVPDLSLLAVGIGVWGGGAALAGVIVGTLVIARIMLAVLLAMGPIFIVLIYFESTKKIFDSWLGHLITYMIVIVATIITSQIVIAIMLAALASYFGLTAFNWILGDGFTPSAGSGIGLILIYGICGVAMQKVIAAADAIGRNITVTIYTGKK